MISIRHWCKLNVVRKYSIRAGSIFKIKVGQLGFDNFKPVKLHVACSTQQDVRRDRTLGKGTSDTFNNKPRFAKNDTADVNNRHVKRAISILNSSIQKSKRIYKSDLENILLDIKKEGISEDQHGILLLQCCGDLLSDELPATRIDLVHKIWDNLQELGVKFTVEHYNALLSCYAENGHTVSATKFIANMCNVEPNEATYRLLLACVCEAGDIEQATDIVSVMKRKGFPASESVFAALVLGHARAGDMTDSCDILDLMHATGVTPTGATYTALLQGFAEAGDKANLLKTHRQASMRAISLNVKQIMKIVISLLTSGHQEFVGDVLKWLPEINSENISTINRTAIHLLHLGYWDAACALLDVSPAPTFETSPSFGAFLIQEMVKANMPVSRILLLTESLVSDGRNPFALERAVGAAMSCGKVEIALSLFQVMKHRSLPLRPHYFWPLFIAASKSSGEKGVFFVLEHMQELGVSPDTDTLADYVLPHVSMASSQTVIRKLQDYGLSVAMALTPVLAVLLKEGHIETAVKLCATFEGHIEASKLVHPLVFAYVTTQQVPLTVKMLQLMSFRAVQISDWVGEFILAVLMFRKIRTEPEQLCELLKALHSSQLHISSFAADAIAGHLQFRLVQEKLDEMRAVINDLVNSDLSIAPSEQLFVDIPHPRDMSLQDLECHLLELRSKDLNRRGVLRRLIQEYCRQGEVEKALKAKQEFEASGYEFSAGMLAVLFGLMVHVGNLNEAERNLRELNELAPSFLLDEHKIIDFAALLVSEKRIEVAQTVLEEHAEKHTVKGGAAVSRNCWRLLNAMAENTDPEQTRSMLQKLEKLGYCSINNILLGPVIRAYLNRDDLEGAAEEFKRCTEVHKATPLQHELLCRLVVKVNEAVLEQGKVQTDSESGGQSDRAADLLQQVLDACRGTHGGPSTHVTLAVVLAEQGMIKQLRHFLMGPQGKLNKTLLFARLKRLVDENKLEAIKNFVEAGKGTMDVAPIYMLMLQLYSRRGDCSGALSLWTSMQDLSVTPSSEFLTTLAELLRSHKLEVPFVVTHAEEWPEQPRPETMKNSPQRSSPSTLQHRS